MNKPVAEFIGTFALVFIGCGAAVIGGMGSGATAIDVLGIAFAFGLAIVAMAYGIGPVSGCHVNPAVSFGVFVAGRMTLSDLISYAIAQVLGAIAGAAVLYLILSGKASGWNGGLGQDGWGPTTKRIKSATGRTSRVTTHMRSRSRECGPLSNSDCCAGEIMRFLQGPTFEERGSRVVWSHFESDLQMLRSCRIVPMF